MLELTVRLVFSLAVVVGLLLLIARLSQRRFRGQSNAMVRVLHRQPISRHNAVTVVSVGSRVLVLGTTEQEVRVLTELDPAELEEKPAVAAVTPLAVALVNASGDVVVDGATVMPNVVRLEAAAALIAPGTYYVRVRSADGTENNYDLQLKTCDVALPCP